MRGMRLLAPVTLCLLLPAIAGAVNPETGFGGTGIDGAGRPDGQIEVRQLVAGGPAHQAGIRVGDVLTHIDGKPTAGSDFQALVNRRLRGKAGTRVSLTVRRPGVETALTFTVTRRQLAVAGHKE